MSQNPRYTVEWRHVLIVAVSLAVAGLIVGYKGRPAFIIMTAVLMAVYTRMRVNIYTIYKESIDVRDQKANRRAAHIEAVAFLAPLIGSAGWLRSPSIASGDFKSWVAEIWDFMTHGQW